MTVNPPANNIGFARLRVSTAAGDLGTTVTATLRAPGGGAGTAFPNNHQEAASFVVDIAVTNDATTPPARWLLAFVEDTVDVGGDYVTATGGTTLSTGVIAIVDLGAGPAAGSFTVTAGDAGFGGRNAAFAKFGTFRMVLIAGSDGVTAGAGTSLENALRDADVSTVGTAEFHFDSDQNNVEGTASLFNPSLQITGTGGIKAKLTAHSRTAGNWGYPNQITASFTLKSCIDGTSGPYSNAALKNMRVAWSTEQNPSASIVKETSDTIDSSGVVAIGATNIDSTWGQVVGGTSFYTQLAVGQNFGDVTTPANEKAEIYAIGTTNAADNEQIAYVFQSGAVHVSPFVTSTDTNRRLRTNTADQLASAKLRIYTTSSLTVEEACALYENHSYATARNPPVYRRTQPTASQTTGSTPGIEAFVANAYAVAIDNASISMKVLRHTDSAQEGSTSTANTGTGGTAGRRRMDFTVANNHIAFNRFRKTSPDDPLSPPTNGDFIDLVTTISLTSSPDIGSSTFTVSSISSLYPGCKLIIDLEKVVIETLDPTSNTITITTTFTSTHSSGTGIRRIMPTYPKNIQFVGNAFSGTNEPTTTVLAVFGVNSEIIFSDLWTGTLTAATLNANGVPTGAGQREQQLGAGSLKAKLTSIINEGNGRVFNVATHNPKDIQFTSIVVTIDSIFLRSAAFNDTTDAIHAAAADLNDAQTKLENSLGYNTNSNSIDTIAPPTDPSALLYWQAGADTTTQRSTFSLTVASGVPSFGFTGDTGNYGYFQQSVAFIAIDTTTKMVITSEVLQSDPTLSRRFTIKIFRITADNDFVDASPDEAPLYVVYSQPTTAGTAMTEVTRGTATAIGTSPTPNWEFNVTMPTNVKSIRVFSIAKVNGSRVIGGSEISIQVGYEFDAVGTFTGFNFR